MVQKSCLSKLFLLSTLLLPSDNWVQSYRNSNIEYWKQCNIVICYSTIIKKLVLEKGFGLPTCRYTHYLQVCLLKGSTKVYALGQVCHLTVTGKGKTKWYSQENTLCSYKQLRIKPFLINVINAMCNHRCLTLNSLSPLFPCFFFILKLFSYCVFVEMQTLSQYFQGHWDLVKVM